MGGFTKLSWFVLTASDSTLRRCFRRFYLLSSLDKRQEIKQDCGVRMFSGVPAGTPLSREQQVRMCMKTKLTTTMEENVRNQGILVSVLHSAYNNGGLWGI